MGIWDRLKHELIDIIEFLDDSNNTIVYRFDRFQNEIKNGAKLIVREGQCACFVREGQLADVKGPGTYTLDTKNLPILSTLLGWKYGFESPFKAEVYFVSTRQFTDLKWGTMNPIMLRDPEFGPVRLRAFGTYTMRVKDPGTFLKQLVGTDSRFTTEEITNQLRNVIVGSFATALGQARLPMLDLAANQENLGATIATKMQPDFDKYGLEVPKFIIENISLPPEVEQALDKRSSMSVVGNLDAYTKYQTAEAIRDAAKNPGAAGTFVGMGLGQMFAGQMAGSAQASAGAASAGPGAPPPIPQAAMYFIAVGGAQAGPFEMGLLRSKVQSGELRQDTLVWRQGMPNWAAAKDVQELAGLFNSAPPPLPNG